MAQNLRTLALSTTLLILSLGCAFVAVCCAEKSSETGQLEQPHSNEDADLSSTSDSEGNDVLSRVLPDKILIVVRDLEGYFEDCGCSGAAKGSISRLPSILPLVEDRTYIFIGNTFSPPSIKDPKRLASVTDALEMQFKEIGQGLGDVVLARDPNSIAAAFNSWVGGDALETLNSASVAGLTQSRGRAVLVVGMWTSTKPDSIVTPRPGLGAAISITFGRGLSPLKDSTGFVTQTIEKVASHKEAGGFVAWWPVAVTEQLTERDLTSDALGAHSAKGLPPSSTARANGQPSLSLSAKEFHQNECATCHSGATAFWQTHKHAHSMLVLESKSKNQDARCVTCHSGKWELWGTVALVTPERAAVDCMTCHSRLSLDPDIACSSCHTIESDPNYSAKKPSNLVCHGKSDKPTGACSRQ